MPFTLHEPTTTYGRGGAGNRTHPSPPPTYSLIQKSPPPNHKNKPRYSTGVGGAGNFHPAPSERQMFRFDEELERERKESVPVYHVGRGGQGNLVVEDRRNSASEGEGQGGKVRKSKEWVMGVLPGKRGS